MIFALARFIAWFGVDISKAQRIAVFVLIGAGLLLILFMGLWVRSCYNRREARLTVEQAEKAKKAIAEGDRKVQIEVLAKSDADVAVAEGIVSNSKAESVNAMQESKKKWEAASDAEIQAELERRAKEQ
jgi:hypothetical protein